LNVSWGVSVLQSANGSVITVSWSDKEEGKKNKKIKRVLRLDKVQAK